jgi:hypothetical protein
MVHTLGFKGCLLYYLFDQDSQYLLAFEWEDPFMRERQQYMWTVLPQGF